MPKRLDDLDRIWQPVTEQMDAAFLHRPGDPYPIIGTYRRVVVDKYRNVRPKWLQKVLHYFTQPCD